MDFIPTIPTSATVPAVFSEVAPGKSRSACNRCHSQKLRCVRQTGQDSCERCLRLKTSCRFAARASRAVRKPPGGRAECDKHGPFSMTTTPVPTLNITSHEITADAIDGNLLFSPSTGTGVADDSAAIFSQLYYPSQANAVDTHYICPPGYLYESTYMDPLSHVDTPNTQLTLLSEATIGNPNSGPDLNLANSYLGIMDGYANYTAETAPASTTARLASLNVALYKCSSNLPSETRARPAPRIDDTTDNSAYSSRRTKLFAIDELFRVTTEFIDLVESLSVHEVYMSATSSSMNGQLSVTGAAHSQQTSCAGQPPVARACTRPLPGAFSDVDEATLLMVGSCHCRLTETYVSIFEMMQACIDIDKISPSVPAPQRDQDWAVLLPELQIGSIAAFPAVRVGVDTPLSSAVTASMYMVLITKYALQSWERVAAVMKRGCNVPLSGYRLELVDLLWSTMSARTDNLLQMINSIKQLL